MKIVLLGDLMLGRLVDAWLEHRPASAPWGIFLDRIRGGDFSLANLECVLSTGGTPWRPERKPFHFRASPDRVRVLEAASLDAVTLANNHTFDFGPAALDEMLGTLSRHCIPSCGAGRTQCEAIAPVRRECRGLRLGVLACTDNEPEWAALPHAPGVCHVAIDHPDDSTERFLAAVREVRQQVEVVIVSVHWGGNWGTSPEAEHCRFGRALVEAGADIVFGHSSHVFRGIEYLPEGVILYGAGDCINDYRIDPVERNDLVFLYEVSLKENRVDHVTLVPGRIERGCIVYPAEAERRWMFARMGERCGALGARLEVGHSGEVVVQRTRRVPREGLGARPGAIPGLRVPPRER